MEDSTRVSQYFALLSAMNPQSGKQRGQRSSCDMIYRVVELYEQGTPVLQVAAAVGVGAKTVARYLRLYRGCRSPADVEAVAPARGGRRAESVKLGEIELDFIMDELAVDPTLGVEEYRERLDTELGVQVSATQICWVLNHTLKQHMKTDYSKHRRGLIPAHPALPPFIFILMGGCANNDLTKVLLKLT